MTRLLLSLAVLMLPPAAQAQRETIPEGVAKGAVGSVATVPSGQMPTVPDLLRITDVVVMGTVGDPRSYLSDDQRDVYTDYPLSNPVFHYQSQVMATPTPGLVQGVTVTQLGGTVMVNGTKFTHKEPALPPLQAGTRGLFLLQHIADKYLITGKFFGAFSITNGTLLPLMTREDFAPEYRNVRVSDAIDSMMTILRARGVPSPR